MRKTKMLLAGILVLGLVLSGNTMKAAPEEAVTLTAQTVDYDAVQKVVQAQGDVKISQKGAVLCGPFAEYRNASGMALMNGGITITHETRRITGEQVEYDTNAGIAVVTGQPRMEDKGGAWITGQRMEYYVKEDRVIVKGAVHMVHPERQIDAISDQADYYSKEQKAVLSGNARAIQEGNTLYGETLTIYLDNKTMDAQGNTKLIIIPNEQ